MRVTVPRPIALVCKLLVRIVAAGAKVIENAPLLRVAYDLVRILYIPECLLCLRFPAIFVRVEFQTEFQVRFTDLAG